MEYEFEFACPEDGAAKVMTGLQSAGFKRIKERPGKYHNVSAKYDRFSNCCNMITDEMIPLVAGLGETPYGRDIEDIKMRSYSTMLTWWPKNKSGVLSAAWSERVDSYSDSHVAKSMAVSIKMKDGKVSAETLYQS
ncbi:MAG: hypothetical protein HY833_03930 [Candidatus Aenigmarchaeota archaeon]|nr:hypothetical protein [Candidatus Aenigmarchaeota archaeon]